MKRFLKYAFMVPLVFLVICGLTTAVWAIPITMQFTAANFSGFFTSSPAPTDPVTGTIVWDADSVNSTINSLTSINLTIDEHLYGLSEVAFLSPFSASRDMIGGLVSGVNGIGGSTDDFSISWDRISLSPTDFRYASNKTQGDIWITDDFASFSITSAPVPEPATLLLLGTGLVGLIGIRRKFKA